MFKQNVTKKKKNLLELFINVMMTSLYMQLFEWQQFIKMQK